MTAHVEIPSDDPKVRWLVRRLKRRAFERLTAGVDVLIDESPGYIVLFVWPNPPRDCSRSLETLLKDGRIQPAKIEEEVEKACAEVAKTVRAMGEKAAYEANVPNLHPDLLTILAVFISD